MKNNWAAEYSNKYTVCLEDGIWSVLKDGEGGKGLYRKGGFVCDLPSMYFYSDVFEGGIVLSAANNIEKTFMVFNNYSDKCIYRASGNIVMKTEDSLIIFEDAETHEEIAIFDQQLFNRVKERTTDGQIGLDLQGDLWILKNWKKKDKTLKKKT